MHQVEQMEKSTSQEKGSELEHARSEIKVEDMVALSKQQGTSDSSSQFLPDLEISETTASSAPKFDDAEEYSRIMDSVFEKVRQNKLFTEHWKNYPEDTANYPHPYHQRQAFKDSLEFHKPLNQCELKAVLESGKLTQEEAQAVQYTLNNYDRMVTMEHERIVKAPTMENPQGVSETSTAHDDHYGVTQKDRELWSRYADESKQRPWNVAPIPEPNPDRLNQQIFHREEAPKCAEDALQRAGIESTQRRGEPMYIPEPSQVPEDDSPNCLTKKELATRLSLDGVYSKETSQMMRGMYNNYDLIAGMDGDPDCISQKDLDLIKKHSESVSARETEDKHEREEKYRNAGESRPKDINEDNLDRAMPKELEQRVNRTDLSQEEKAAAQVLQNMYKVISSQNKDGEGITADDFARALKILSRINVEEFNYKNVQ